VTDYADLSAYVALPRITGLALSQDGARLVAVVQRPDPKGARYVSALWEVPLDDSSAEPVRLTRSEKGESAPAFLPDGSLVFTSVRPEPDADGDDQDEGALWVLPPAGEPRVLARTPGGLSGPVVARHTGTVLAAGSRLIAPTPATAPPTAPGPGAGALPDTGTGPGAGDGVRGAAAADTAAETEPAAEESAEEQDRERRRVRRERKVSAILHTGYPVRHWDHELGAESPRLFVLKPGEEPRDLAPHAGVALTEADCSISADAVTVAASWRTRGAGGAFRPGVVLVDVASGERTALAEEPGRQQSTPRISPDGSKVALLSTTEGSYDTPREFELRIVPTKGGGGEAPVAVPVGDLWPGEWVWSADSQTLYVTGDLHGRGAVLAVDPATGTVRRRLAADASYSELCPSPDGRWVYALRSAVDSPPTPVRLDTAAADQGPVTLPTPAPVPALPGRLTEVATEVGEATVRGWLCLPPEQDGPAPLMLWIHGGPFASFNAWSWRWNPWVAVAHGWAVLMADPALSTGYGPGFIARAWPHRAGPVWADLEALLDAVTVRSDVDGERTACLGASFGGYLTNWVAGHTDRFGAIVTHSGTWALDQKNDTADVAHNWLTWFGRPADHPDWYAENSPHRFADRIRTPMLITHGNRDYRVPVSEALRLWWDLVSRWDGDPAELPHRFLNFPGENHWILSPANSEVWYATVLGFCGQHVLGRTP
jgi:dipeptidyl aminopeptidase/acylaminoacyl peptidase